jgi:hypothetical protein
MLARNHFIVFRFKLELSIDRFVELNRNVAFARGVLCVSPSAAGKLLVKLTLPVYVEVKIGFPLEGSIVGAYFPQLYFSICPAMLVQEAMYWFPLQSVFVYKYWAQFVYLSFIHNKPSWNQFLQNSYSFSG